MTGANEFLTIIDWLFDFQANLWHQVIAQNIFLIFMVVISMVAWVINLRNNTKQ